jgi:hypothetical protein
MRVRVIVAEQKNEPVRCAVPNRLLRTLRSEMVRPSG